MKHLFQGLYTALITPFTASGKLDEKGLRQLLRFQLQNQVDGIVLLGTTGESPTLNSIEKERIIQIGVEEVKDKAVLVIGTGSYSTHQTIENTQQAQTIGADAALVVTPYYNKPSQEGLYRHFKALSESTDLPICIYNIQGRTGQNLQTDTLKHIAALPRIVAVKEASGNLSQIDEVIQAFRHTDFKVISGDDGLTFPIMTLGGHGIISVVSNLLPKPIKDLVQACQRGDVQTARTLHYQLSPFFKGAFIETNPIPIKAAMHLIGMAAGPCRLPLCDLAPENLEKLHSLIQNIPKEWLHG